METLTTFHWKELIHQIQKGKCTPFLGAGACFDVFPMAKAIANEWANGCNYPMTHDRNDLAKVAQYLTLVMGMRLHPQKLIKEKIEKLRSEANAEKLEKLPHSFLADLPIPIYITTNYDNLLVEALKKKGRSPIYHICEWNKSIRSKEKMSHLPSVDSPLVYHLHGHMDTLESMVLTENDYLDFLANISIKSLPPVIQGALGNNTLLFIGYSLNDITFKTLYRGIVNQFKSNTNLNIAVQLEKKDMNQRNVQEILFRSFNNIHIFWGTASNFIDVLKDKWTTG